MVNDTDGRAHDEGLVPVPGTANFRLVGPVGHVRPGVLFRADGLSDLGDEGRAALRELGIRTIVDLRQEIERTQHPDDVAGLDLRLEGLELLPVDLHLPSLGGLGDLYRLIVDHRGPELATVVRILADPAAQPAVVHCSAGKDRTGIVSALVLDLIGVPREEIAADYARTARLLRGPIMERIVVRAVEAGLGEQQMAIARDSPGEVILELLGHLDETHGGARAYLGAHGVTDGDVDALRRALLI